MTPTKKQILDTANLFRTTDVRWNHDVAWVMSVCSMEFLWGQYCGLPYHYTKKRKELRLYMASVLEMVANSIDD